MEVEDGAATSQKGCSVALPEGASSLPLRVHASGESGIPRFPITPRPQALAGEVSKAASKPRRPAPWPPKPKPRVPGRARGRARTCGVGWWGTEAQPAVWTPAGDDPEAWPLVRTPAEEEPEALRACRAGTCAWPGDSGPGREVSTLILPSRSLFRSFQTRPHPRACPRGHPQLPVWVPPGSWHRRDPQLPGTSAPVGN